MKKKELKTDVLTGSYMTSQWPTSDKVESSPTHQINIHYQALTSLKQYQSRTQFSVDQLIQI